MKTVAYMKVDPDIEEIREQKEAILEFAKREQMPISRFIEVSISCVEVTKAPKINPLLGIFQNRRKYIERSADILVEKR